VNPERIVVDPGLEREPLGRRILDRYRDVPAGPDRRFWLDDPAFLEGDVQARLKRVLRLSGRRGGFARRCPGQRGMLCCSYHVIDHVLGCPADCQYCILQTVLENLPVTVNVRHDDLFRGLAAYLDRRAGRFTRIGTGELSDSLMLEEITGFARRAVGFFARRPDAVLELKTKSAGVDALAALDPRGGTIVSFSLSPARMIDRYERGTSRLDDRIAAASRLASRGYPIGLHFDPLILEGGWENEYGRVIEALAGAVDPGDVAWVSIAAFRFTPGLERRVRERFPLSGLLAGSFVRGRDGKLRYPDDVRVRAYRLLLDLLEPWRGKSRVCVYFCMESEGVWEAVTGRAPTAAELAAALDRRAGELARVRGHPVG
jgi:spore photoproduct lyase